MAPTPTIAVSHANHGVGDATWILDSWARELITYARQMGYSVVDIGGNNLVYERFTDILQATKPAVLFNFSHGCENFLMGNDLRCTLTRGWEGAQNSCGICGMQSNLKTVSGTAVVAYSCHSAAQLGKCAVAYGAPAYLGFADNLIVVSDKYGMQDIFKQALMPIAYRILGGWTIGAAAGQASDDLYELVKEFKAVELLAVPLWYNRTYLSLHGNTDWKLL